MKSINLLMLILENILNLIALKSQQWKDLNIIIVKISPLEGCMRKTQRSKYLLKSSQLLEITWKLKRLSKTYKRKRSITQMPKIQYMDLHTQMMEPSPLLITTRKRIYSFRKILLIHKSCQRWSNQQWCKRWLTQCQIRKLAWMVLFQSNMVAFKRLKGLLTAHPISIKRRQHLIKWA
jgi:hypothetical protein